ncbi:hypothetical protein HPB49_019728 [Dermacentor silvarum]|uniref:Uncharacterized protein n=1 Tax=Dermacentor silvarum TaxID=543639 RepID=A0ACB8CH22_DERSI|nr:hypothetical protein HPB49_019728 [Dermacentor silvarum]
MRQPASQVLLQLAASRVSSRVQPGRIYSEAAGDRPPGEAARRRQHHNTCDPFARDVPRLARCRHRLPVCRTGVCDRVVAAGQPRTPTVRPCPWRSPSTGQQWQLDPRTPPSRAYCSGTAAPCAADTLSSQSTYIPLHDYDVLALQETCACREVSLPGYIGYSNPRNQHRGWRILTALLNPKTPRFPVLAIAVAHGISELALAEQLADAFAAPAVTPTLGAPAVDLQALYVAVFGRGISPQMEKKKKIVWMKTRYADWWDRIVAKEFTDADWKENFRTSRASFNHLVALMAPFVA